MKSGTNKKERLKWWKRVSRKKRLMLAAGIFLICAVSVWIFLVFQKDGSYMGLRATIQAAQAEMGSISSTIIGTGNLEGDTAFSIEIPSGIVIEEVLVESGD